MIIVRIPQYLLIGFLKLYRMLISPLYGNVCRFYPSCSAYALESVQRHGAIGGSVLTVRRLGRCNPWNVGGYDPVPGDWKHPRQSMPSDYHEACDYGEANDASFTPAQPPPSATAHVAGTPKGVTDR